MQKVLEYLWNAMNDVGGTIIIVLDEIDNLGTDDKILYSLPRARDKNYVNDDVYHVNDDVYPSVIGISNDLQWRDNLDPAAKDSLYDDSIFSAPYNANDLRDILSRRASKAFHDTDLMYEGPDGEEFTISVDLGGDESLDSAFEARGIDRTACTLQGIDSSVLSEDVIPLCAAYAAQDKGSARQAICTAQELRGGASDGVAGVDRRRSPDSTGTLARSPNFPVNDVHSS